MYAVDFTYDNKKLSDFNFIVCKFDGKSDVEATDKGSEITFVTSPMQSGKRYVTGGTKYDECLSTSFQICKDPDFYDQSEMRISSEEFRALSRWLNRRQYLWFKASDWCDPDEARPWVRASFTLTRLDIGNVTYGIELEMQTDSPFCYGDEVIKEYTFSNNSLSAKLIDENDEIGETFPSLKITCGQSGTLTIEDDRTGCSCSVANCISGEVIEFSGDTKIVTASNAMHDIANDFNYDYFCFGNTYNNRENIITVSMPCTMELRYRPIYKDTL